ncbi:12180_t:CDS:2 [Gigaspora margarita]|uniref:12180_t:CDS:1 n=1 Tax=Gigaspora margarita TaxID=4874 RepID=A0ABN7VVG8_GIGMA|nr:12180_t:CDS:2 [Gigaspora margarita]
MYSVETAAEIVLCQLAPTTNFQNRRKGSEYNAKLGLKIGEKLEEKWNGLYRVHEALENGT